MTKEVVKAEDFGLTQETATTIENSFLPKIIERNALVQFYEQVLTKEITPDTCKEAKEVRLKLVKVRTGIADIHKAQKAMALQYGRFVDAVKTNETLPVEQMEERLKDIELYFERIEEKRLLDLKTEREELILPYVEVMIPGLNQLSEETFQRVLNGEKIAFEERAKAKMIAIEEEKQKAIELENLRKENELLKKQVETPIIKVEKGMTENEIIMLSLNNLKLSFEVDNETTQNILLKFEGFKTWAIDQLNK